MAATVERGIFPEESGPQRLMDMAHSAVLNLIWFTFSGGDMSTSSCPQCGKQVTIPSGVGTSTKVRCPLCHSQYTLADALVNMPPLLELVDEDAEDYLDTQPAIPGGLTVAAADLPLEAPDAIEEPAADVDFGEGEPVELDDLDEHEAAAPALADLSLDAPLDLEATTDFAPPEDAEPAHNLDDLTVEDKDTEVEELSAAVGDSADDDDDAASESISFDMETPGEPAEDEMALDFGGASPSTTDDEVPIQFDNELTAESAGEDAGLSFDMAESADEPAVDFGAPEESDADEMALDFGQPVEEGAPAIAAGDAEPADETEATDEKGKKKKKKEKKQKVKAADGEPRPKRRLSTVLSATFGGLLGLIVALYLILWLGPDYDILGMSKWLPSAMVPGSFNKPTYVATQKPALDLSPPADDSPANESIPDEPAADVPAEPADIPTEPVDSDAAPLDVPATEPAAEAPADSPDEMPAETPAPEPTEPAAAPEVEPGQPEFPPVDAPAEPAAATEPAVDPLADPLTDPAADPFAPSEAPEEMPAEIPATNPLTDAPPAEQPDAPPLTTPAPPLAEPPAAEMPAAADDPFAETTTRPAATDDPFADSPAELEAPAEPVGPVNAAEVSPDALAQAIQDAEAADRQMIAAQGTASEGDLKRIRSNFYVSLFRMADGATFVKDEAESGQLDALRLQMDHLVRQLAADPKRIESLKFNAGRWLEFSRRTTPGIILAGKVQSTAPVGKLHEIKLDIGLEDSTESIVSVLSATDPGVNDGDQAVVLGTIVENPAEELAGYEGAEPTVVWNGMLLTLSPQ